MMAHRLRHGPGRGGVGRLSSTVGGRHVEPLVQKSVRANYPIRLTRGATNWRNMGFYADGTRDGWFSCLSCYLSLHRKWIIYKLVFRHLVFDE